jgi:hypothetical protein
VIKKRSQLRAGHPEPQVGIFWLIGPRLVIDSVPLSKASEYADFKIFEGNHISIWDELEKRGEVPRDIEYEEFPRGRANFNIKTQQFNLYLDRCILRKKNVVKRLMRLMHLPENTMQSTDAHYRCFRCLAKEQQCSL